MITQEILKTLVHYNPDTGIFTAIGPTRGGIVEGTILGSKDKKGYLLIMLLNKRYKAHRLAYLYMLGRFPHNLVDHKDRNKTNNKWNNIREASDSENQQNKIEAQSNNESSGLLGVSYSAKLGRYRARIQINHVVHYLGLFKTAQEAHAKYLEAKLNLHPFYEAVA